MRLHDLIEALERYYEECGDRDVVSILIVGGKMEVISYANERSDYVN